jgi:hypothetical protein
MRWRLDVDAARPTADELSCRSGPRLKANHSSLQAGQAGDGFGFTGNRPHAASESVASLDHVKIGAGGVVAVDAGTRPTNFAKQN